MFNVSHVNLEIILGIPPLMVQSRIITIKHFLKVITVDVGLDTYKEFIVQETKSFNPSITNDLRDVYQFLQWKMINNASMFTELDTAIVESKVSVYFQTGHVSTQRRL